jgi:L-amino acid N-acyltransferase YncA
MEDDSGTVVGIGIISYWAWNKMAWIWDLTIDVNQRGRGYGRVLLKAMLRTAKKTGARVMMDFGTDNPNACSFIQLLIKNGFRVCGTNDRWFSDNKNSTAVFYSYDL